MLARIESYLHRLRRRLSRSEWAVRLLRLEPSEGTAESPGLLLVQIDGLSRAQLERAITTGRMPYLARLLRQEGAELHTFYPGLPTTTPAVQAELYYGARCAVPAFRFYSRSDRRLVRMWDPERAKACETECGRQAEGLLRGGSSWSNIYSGGAGAADSHFCTASVGLGDLWRARLLARLPFFVVFYLPSLLRITVAMLQEAGRAIADFCRALGQGRNAGREGLLIFSRVFVGVGLQELVRIGARIDLARGLPIVHLNFLSYDERAHRRGPGSRLALASLRSIDRTLRSLARAAYRSTRRDYAVWIFSDHGQEATRPYGDGAPGGIEAAVHRAVATTRRADAPWRRQAPEESHWSHQVRGRGGEKRRARARTDDQLTAEEAATFAVAAMGPLGHVTFARPRSAAELRALAQQLVRDEGVPGVLVRGPEGRGTWFHARGETAVPEGVPALLPHPEPLRAEIAADLARLCHARDAGDLVLSGWSPWEDVARSFVPERGAHGGFGPHESQGFLLLPARTPLPPGTEHYVRPEALRSAAEFHLGRSTGLQPRAYAARPVDLRIMTYNVHGCGGLDGRISPRRIARIVRAEDPDVVALQEIDLGRRRSRAEDQAGLIARELGFHVVFCPTVTRDREHYGHAVLSRFPLHVVKRLRLPHDPASWWQEPRSALWVRIAVGGGPVNVITTHLGLGPAERTAQMQALLGADWIGGIPPEEPVVLCGDFNALPGSRPYRLAAQLLRDVQSGGGHRPLGTFSAQQPLVRLDHVFMSAHFERIAVRVVRNDATRVASDHLPLVADLRLTRPAATATTAAVPAVSRPAAGRE